MITYMTRQLSFEDIKPERKKRYEQILDRLITGRKTAKELAIDLYELGFIPSTERNFTAPRLTELTQMGLVRVVDKKKCEHTGKKVAVYEITADGIQLRYANHIPNLN